MNSYEVPVSKSIFEEKYFKAKCSVETAVNTPGCVLVCNALGLRSVSYEWAKDYYGRQLNDEIELKYHI